MARLTGWIGRIGAAGLLVATHAGPAFSQAANAAQDAHPVEGTDGAAPAPAVGLDALLRLPSAAGEAAPKRDSSERLRWEERFREVRGELEDARARLADSQRELGELAAQSDAWQVSAPGAQSTPENSPISYKLRQEIRGRREDVELAERRLRELDIEASLAGVPPEWRAAPPTDEAGSGS